MVAKDVLPKIKFSNYVGEWIVICDDKVIGHNKNLAKLNKCINNCKSIPTITKIPASDIWLF